MSRVRSSVTRAVGAMLAAGVLVTVNMAGCGGNDTAGILEDSGADGAVGTDGSGGGADTSTTSDGSGGGCASPLSSCSGGCVDQRNDPANCGGCGKACGAGLACSQGACVTVCPQGQDKCTVGNQPRCVTLATDRANCGTCGHACASGEVCSDGKCALSCSVAYTACSGLPYVPPPPDGGVDGGDAGDSGDDGSDAMMSTDADDAATDAADASDAMVADAGPPVPYCANLQTDEDNCGACGLACDFNTKCSKGLCCVKGKQNCGGACTDVRFDDKNCGGCGTVCPDDKPHCSLGTCSSLYTFSGIQTDIPITQLGGWTQCYLDTFANNDTTLANDIMAACTQTNILVGCRQTGSDTLHLAAEALHDDVFFDTGTGNTTHNANGVEWYFNTQYSMGFAPGGDTVERDECDVNSADGDQRLCFHTLPSYGAGYRCGANDLNGNSDWERIVFQAN